MSSKTIGLCLSGGGHRASIFSLGALLYLVDASRHHDVRVISSVSGGSLTSGFLAAQKNSFRDMTSKQFDDDCAAKWARQIAGNPAWWYTAIIMQALALIICILEFARPFWLSRWTSFRPPSWEVVITYFLVACLLAPVIGRLSKGTFWGWWETWLYVGIAIPAALLLAVAVLQSPVYFVYFVVVLVSMRVSRSLPDTDFGRWCRLIGFLALIGGFPWMLVQWDPGSWTWHLPAIVFAAWALHLRNRVADFAFRTMICGQEGLSEASSEPRHIFCATEMETGTHAYFSHDLIYLSDCGLGVPADLHLSTALQASANFPVAFPYRALRLKGHDFALGGSYFPSVVLSDGGVYDNTGVSWFTEFTDRKARLKRSLDLRIAAGDEDYSSSSKPLRHRVEEQLTSMEQDPEIEIVVNSSYPLDWRSQRFNGIPVLGEIEALLRIEGTLYENRGREQCRGLHRQFWLKLRKGAVVSIEQRPEILQMAFRNTKECQQMMVGRPSAELQALDVSIRDMARQNLNDLLQELGVSDMPDALLERYFQLAGAIRDRAVFGPTFETELSGAARRSRELDEQIAHLNAQRAQVPTTSPEEAKIEMEIDKCESERDGILHDLRSKRTAWELDSQRIDEMAERAKEARRCRDVPTTFLPLGTKVTSELLRHGYLNCMNMCYLLLDGFPWFHEPPSKEEFDRLAHGLTRERYPAESISNQVMPEMKLSGGGDGKEMTKQNDVAAEPSGNGPIGRLSCAPLRCTSANPRGHVHADHIAAKRGKWRIWPTSNTSSAIVGDSEAMVCGSAAPPYSCVLEQAG